LPQKIQGLRSFYHEIPLQKAVQEQGKRLHAD
jgi:hypothetical protein